jgi:hypothetical protein
MRVARCNELGLNCTLQMLACRTKAPPPQVSGDREKEGSRKECPPAGEKHHHNKRAVVGRVRLAGRMLA